MRKFFPLRHGPAGVLAMGALVSLALTACGGLKMGVGLKGNIYEKNMMTLDGDTFSIRSRVGDNMFIVSKYGYSETDRPDYLLKLERNGFYYPQLEANHISTIDDTDDFVCIDEKDIYDIKAQKVVFVSPCYGWGLSYLGKWQNKLIFASNDSICFSDGQCVALQGYVHYENVRKGQSLTLVDGAQKAEATFADLYHAAADTAPAAPSDASLERLTRNYFITEESGVTSVNAGFGVELEVPKGHSEADKAIRQWMLEAVTGDAFWQLESKFDAPVSGGESLDKMKASLDKYGALWKKLFRYENPELDSVRLRVTCDIEIRRVADCADYTTYHYWASLDGGGVHALPYEYYITYDKRRGEMLEASNSVKPGMMRAFRREVLRSMKKQYDNFRNEKSSWEEFTWNVFSFQVSSFDTSGMSEATRAALEHYYSCDAWAGWNGYSGEAFTEDNFPLTHFAVLPEGVVLTYHAYQIDCFAAGEYYALVPFSKANPCLTFDYSRHDDLKPALRHFIK